MSPAHSTPHPRSTHARALWLLALALACAPLAAHAAVYRCVDAHGHLAFQDTPCPAGTLQSELALAAQPMIGSTGEQRTETHAITTQRRAQHPKHERRARTTRRKQPTSWECRAADGEVFYRHTRCPGTVAGDGVVRGDGTTSATSSRRSRRHNAWSPIRVHGVKISRTEACRRIHSAGAALRDGHQRDANVSAYDHAMGRDPCDTP